MQATIVKRDNQHILLDRIKFSILLVFQIPAVIISLLIFIFFIIHPKELHALHHKALLVLLLVNFIQLSFVLPFSMDFFRHSHVTVSTPTFCKWWNFAEFDLYVISEFLMAIISIQRHLLIFNIQILRTRSMRIILHHLPLLICIIYPIIFYAYAILIYPCDGTQWDYTDNLCGLADCYLLYDKILGTYDWTFNNGVPLLINASANALLILRVIRRKHIIQRTSQWRYQRRMTVQLFAISILYIIAWAPCIIVAVVQIFIDPKFLNEIQKNYFLDLNYVVCLFLPWVCIGLFPELHKWVCQLIHRRRAHNAIMPERHN